VDRRRAVVETTCVASGWALARDEPALAILHTTAGLGNGVGAIATARVNRAPLVVLVGQQDRRHLALEPFVTGYRLDDLAGTVPGVGGRTGPRTYRVRWPAPSVRRGTGAARRW
jgi:hypothetical protein